jgi:hypothetical protein
MARAAGSPTVLRLRTDAPIFEIAGIVPNGSMVPLTMIVDGALVRPQILSSSFGVGGGWNFGSVKIDFDSRKMRDIWLETGLGVAYIRFAAADIVLPVNEQSEPQITVVGDSYLQASSPAFCNGGGIAMELAARLGIRKVATDAIGGTGYWNTGGGIGSLNDRLPGHAADNSTIYLVMAGLNDYRDILDNQQLSWPAQSEFEQGVLAYMRGLRAARPDAVIAVTAPFCPIPSMSDSTYVANPVTNGSGQGDFLYKSALFKRSLQQIAGPWVFIDVLMGTGWLNSSGATGDVTNLQWLTGGSAFPGTTATFKLGNTRGGAGGGYGGIIRIPVLSGGSYLQAPELAATGGSGFGLQLASTINSSGQIVSVNIVNPGHGYTSGGLPTIEIDRTYQLDQATLGTPVITTAINPDGQYPLIDFAPPGATAADLNNIVTLLHDDTVHPSPLGVNHLSRRLAENIYQAVMAL